MNFKSILLALIVILIWGSNFVVIKIGVNEIAPLIVLGLRFFFAGLIFLPFMKWPGWKQARMIMLVGLLMGPLHQGFLYIALETMPAGLISIIMKSNVLMVTLIGWLFLKERIGWRTWTGILVGLIGVFVLVSGSDLTGNFLGVTYSFISAFFIALTYIAMKKVDHVHAPTYIVLMSLPVSPLIFLGSYVINGTGWISDAASLNWDIIASVVLYQALILSITHMIWQRLMAQYPVSQVIPWTLLIPVVAVATAVIFLQEELTLPIIIGGGLVISGVTVTTLRRLKRNKV
jgi:O-acetylserine/cysteine efflux transporter